MNYAQALKGRKTRSYLLNAVQSQAETEIGRKLSKDEASKLLQRFPIECIYDATHKVNMYCKYPKQILANL
jgi:hypothetical protein